jgi:ATP-dependent Clp protease adaptor protein ClpS
MLAVSAPSPVELDEPVSEELTALNTPWVTIVWNDPVNLMSYVTFVFQNYFGYAKKKAEKLMLEVHNDGRSVVASGSREEMERDVQALHEYGLWATMEKQD